MNCMNCNTTIVIAEAEFIAEHPNVAELSFTVVHYCEKCGLIYIPCACPHYKVCNWPEIVIKSNAMISPPADTSGIEAKRYR